MPVRVSVCSSVETDPISLVLAPPKNESLQERQARIAMEKAEKLVSDEIDAQLHKERQQAKRLPKPVKILLLGQSESGKSTTLKNFQLMCEPKAFRSERPSWRAIIQLNVIRSLRIILDALVVHSSTRDFQPSPHSSYSSYASTSSSLRPDSDLLALRARLLTVLDSEETLKRRIATPDDLGPPSPSSTRLHRRINKEIAVNSSVAWKHVFMRDANVLSRDSIDTQNAVDWEAEDDPGPVLHARSEDMKRLWGHPTVRAILDRQGIRLQETAGFFLDELDVVTSLRYVPTDEHVLRARLKTLGVSEQRMRLTDPNGSITREFRFFDVGGQRSMRARWVPYFDDMEAIIFLAPISAFDQALAEDPSVNRLADSVDIWTSITSNKLLQKTNIIIFLNKIDLLQAKLASGIRFADYFPAYGLRPNDYDSISKYIRKQFNAILKQESPTPRLFYSHLTNVVDAKSTAYVLAGVKDMLMRFHLRESRLIL
ncbi:guanine nucleotide binding protein, alpha subunit [Mycena sanguinolenta]|nr:guanine nucleotide binding protein, alpha subunit [Mycena sanguinolenta]